MAEAEQDSPSIDYPDHQRTFAGFVTASKLIILVVAAVLINLAVIAFADSTFFRIVGFVMIVVASITAFAETRTSGAGTGSLAVVVLSLLILVLATA